MEFFFILQRRENTHSVDGYVTTNGKFYTPMRKKDWREKVLTGKFYSKTGRMVFKDLETSNLCNFLEKRFSPCKFIVVEE